MFTIPLRKPKPNIDIVPCKHRTGTWNVFFPILKEKSPSGVSSYAEINGIRLYSSDRAMNNRIVGGEVKDKFGSGRQLRLISENASAKVRMETFFRLYKNCPACIAGLKITNIGKDSLELGRASPFFMKSSRSACLDLGGDFNDYKIYIDSGNWVRALVRDLNYDPLARRYEREMCNTAEQDWVEADNQHRSMGICAVFNPKTARGLILSFLTFQRSRVEIRAEYSDKRLEWMAAESDFAGYELRPEQEIQSDLLWISDTQNPLLALEEYGAAVREYNQIKIKEIPSGWCSWYPKLFRDNISEGKILSSAKAIKKHFAGFGIRWIQIDYGWFEKNMPGEYERTNERFSHGMKWLGRKLAKLGFEMGLWFCPSVVTEHSSVFRKRPDCVLHDRLGRPAPRHLSPWSWKPHGLTFDLDPTHPVAENFLKRIFHRAVFQWGVTYFKNDFLEQVSRRFVEHKDKKAIRGIETYRVLLKIIRDAIGKNPFVLGCSNLSNGSLGLIDSNKTAPDIGVGEKGEKHRRTFRPYGHLRTTITTIAGRWFQHGNFWINDPDVLIFEGASRDEARIRATVVALSGGALMLGDDMRKVVRNKELVALYKICLPPYGKAARPIDLFENDYPRIWDLPIEKDFGAWHVTALFNFEDDAEEITVDFEKLGLEKEGQYLVWDFWDRKLPGVFSRRMKIRVKGVSTRLFLIRKFTNMPAFLSTDMHLTQGGVEVNKAVWDKTKRELSGVCMRPVGENGKIFVFCPEPYRAEEIMVEGKRFSPYQTAHQVIEIPLLFDKKAIAWRVLF